MARTQDEPEPKGDGRSPWASHSDRFPNDQLLRGCKFRIYLRPKGKPALWRSIDGRIMDQPAALALVEAATVAVLVEA